MARRPKIGVLTFHRCINYGSYWQARCLVEGLRDLGHEAILLDHVSPDVDRQEWRCALKPQPGKRHAGDIKNYAAKTRAFFRAFEALPLSCPFPLDEPARLTWFDQVVVGSDEVWNLRHPWYGGRTLFYGAGLAAGRLVSYAASFGNHDASDGLPNYWRDLLARFAPISVRDRNSAEIVRDAIGIEPELVLDPCLAFPPAVMREPTAPCEPYVAVYGHDFPPWFAEAVREWRKKSRLRLLSIGYRNDWADEQLIGVDPNSFARLMRDASAIVTSFFHGCVFALLGARPFVCVSSHYRHIKLRDLMEVAGTEHRLVDESSVVERLPVLLGDPLENAVLSRLAERRKQSRRFLSEALEPECVPS